MVIHIASVFAEWFYGKKNADLVGKHLLNKRVRLNGLMWAGVTITHLVL